MPDADPTGTSTDASTSTDTTTTSTDANTSTDATTSTDTGSPDLAAEIEKWKALSRKHEQRARENAAAQAELDKLRQAQMSDTERAVAEAKAQGESEATTRFAKQLAAARIEAALTGVVPDPSTVVEDLDLGKYVTDTGDVDAEKVNALREKYAGFAKPATPAPPDFGGGNRGGDASGKPQLTRDDVQRLTRERKFEEIEAARLDGRLNDLLGIKS